MKSLRTFQEIVSAYDSRIVVHDLDEIEEIQEANQDYRGTALYRRADLDESLSQRYPGLSGTALETLYRRYEVRGWNMLGTGISMFIDDALGWPKGEALVIGVDFAEGSYFLHISSGHIFREPMDAKSPTPIAFSFEKLLSILDVYSWAKWPSMSDQEFKEVTAYLEVKEDNVFWTYVRRHGEPQV